MNLKKIAKKHYVNLRGWHTNRKIVVIESDDWGSIRTNNSESLNVLKDRIGSSFGSNLFNKYDTLESRDDLNELFGLLKSFKDIKGNHPVVTANALSANPDFDKIKQNEFKSYFYQNLSNTYERVFGNDNVLKLWLNEGINKRLLWPQFHGREHLNFKWWMDDLRAGNEVELLAFNEYTMLGMNNTTPPRSANGYMAAFDYTNEEEFANFEKVINEGTDLFEKTFGFRSKSFVAPCSIRSDKMDDMLFRNGLLYHQMGQQTTPQIEGYRLINRFWGDTNTVGQIYWRRNSTFEPYKTYPNTYVHDVMEDARIAFRCRKPLVINSHRINYVDGLEKGLRTFTLDLLNQLLTRLLDTYPDIEFFTSDQLGDFMNAKLKG